MQVKVLPMIEDLQIGLFHLSGASGGRGSDSVKAQEKSYSDMKVRKCCRAAGMLQADGEVQVEALV